MAEKTTDQEQIKKSIDSVVDQILSTEKTSQEVNKAMPTSLDANGGHDKIRSGTPLMSEEELAAKKKKEEEAKKAQEEAAADPVAKAQKEKEDKEKEAKEKEMKEKDAKKCMKKSLEDLAGILDEEELELIKAWREQDSETQSTETVSKSMNAPQPQADNKGDELKKALADIVAPLQKAMSEKDDLIKSLGEKIEKLASQPAYDRRSISNLETLEKSGAQGSQDISKSQVIEKLLELQRNGKGVTSYHVAEFEGTGNISDPAVKSLVFKELKLN